MPQPPNPPRPKLPSRPEIIDMVPDSPVRKQRRFDSPQAREPLPPPPPLPGEFQPTLPSPASLPEPAATPDKASAAALRRRAEEAEARAAKLEEAAKRATTAPALDPLGDEAIGKMVKAVVSAITKRFGAPAVLLGSLLGGGYVLKTANEKPVPPPLTAAQFEDRVGKFEERVGHRLDGLTKATNETIDLTRCLRKKTGQIGGSLLPAPDRMGSALKPQPFEDDCPDSPKRLPEK